MDNVETDKVPHTQTDKVPQTGEASKNSEQPPEATQKLKKRKDPEHRYLHGNTLRKLGMQHEL